MSHAEPIGADTAQSFSIEPLIDARERHARVTYPRPDIDELPLVMAEIARAMDARATALTIHPDDGTRPRVIYADAMARIGVALVDRLLQAHISWDHQQTGDRHRWISTEVDETCRDILLVPVALVEGHSRLVITVYFDHLDDAGRAEAEQVYVRRAPFAIGYFRLWQLNRTREKALVAMRSALNLTGMAVILLDRAGRVAFANNAAERLLAEGDGLRRINGSIRAMEVTQSVRLQVAIDHVIASSGADSVATVPDRRAPTLTLDRVGKPSIVVSVLPTAETAIEMHDIAAIVYAIDPSARVTDLLRPVCQAYGLSPVETQLTCALIEGHTLGEAAKQMRLKSMTARSYLKQVFFKTDTHRQAELMQLMLSSIIRTSSEVRPLVI